MTATARSKAFRTRSRACSTPSGRRWRPRALKESDRLSVCHPAQGRGKVDPKINNAWFNYRLVYGVMWGTDTGNGNEGKAAAMHNFKRTVSLLQLSLKDLGSLPSGATEMK